MSDSRKWRRLLASASLLVGSLVGFSSSGRALAAPTRYEAENAVCQGTVDSNHAGFSGTGFCNPTNAAGAFVEWTVNLPEGQQGTSVPLTFRHANGSTSNRPMDLTVNGRVIATGVAFNPTGAWTTWQTVDITGSNFFTGSNTVRATATTANGGPNLDWLELDFQGAADYQAENATIFQGVVESNHAGFTGTGFVNYNNVVGSYVEWTVSTASAGSTGLSFRFANGSTSNRPMDITVNGTLVADERAFNPTGAWSTWQTVIINANLNAGNNRVRATATAANGGPNVDKLTVGTAPPPPPGDTPVEINGQLRVCGNRLCNQHGQPIQLRGMSSHGLQWYDDCLTSGSLNALADDWTADVLRISMYIQEGGYETNPRLFTDRVHNLIEQATSRGMYALVDWHMLDPGDPFFNLDRAKTFFTEIAQRHNGKNNLLYEIANEPNGVSWARVKSYAEQLIPVIRQHDPETTILVGTRAWSSLGVSDGANESEVINNPVNASNIMYVFHFYAASHGSEYLNALSRAADRIPMFVTEFGTQTFTGDGANNFTMSQQYLDLMRAKKISWVNWNYSHDFRSGAVFKEGTCPNGPWTGTGPLKPAGVWVRERIRTPADDFPTG